MRKNGEAYEDEKKNQHCFIDICYVVAMVNYTRHEEMDKVQICSDVVIVSNAMLNAGRRSVMNATRSETSWMNPGEGANPVSILQIK